MSPPPSRALRVFVVEDHAQLTQTLAAWFTHNGHHVRTASRRQSAIEALSASPCDLLICEILLTDGSGLDILSCIEPKPALAVSMTAGGNPRDSEMSVRAGYDRLLRKPFGHQDLVAVMARTLDALTARRVA